MPSARSQSNDIDVDLGRLFASLLVHWRRILGISLILTLLAFMAAWSMTPLYRAETRILIETRESVFTRPEVTNDDRPLLDEEGITSQVQVIGSSDILKQVARDLDLASRSEFGASGDISILKRVLISVGLLRDPRDVPPEERALVAFRERLEIYRVERSRVIVVQFSSSDPQLAAEVPNRIADAYIAVQRAAKLQSTTDATQWLQPEIQNLSERVKEAEARVADYRAQSDLLIGQNNLVLATQQLSELSSELSRVRANRSAAEANAQSLREGIDAGASLEAMPAVLSSPLIQRLRERAVELQAQIADLSTSLLGNHPRLRALNSQLGDLDAQIRAEARKILTGLETEARTAAAREASLVADLDRLKEVSALADDQQVELRALEREAAAQRELLESYLSRYREAASRGEGNYLPADARVFARATPPSQPYFPKILPITIAVFIGSLLLMAVVTLMQELFSGRAMRPAGEGFYDVSEVAMPVAPSDSGGRELVREASFGRIGIERAANRLIATQARRAIVLSPEGDEAAAASVLIARELADSGLRVLLLDLTSIGAASRPMLDGESRPGITDLLSGEAQFTEVIHPDQYSECHVIPAGTAEPERAMKAVDRLPIILRSLATAYDLVVVECGPADAQDIARLVDERSQLLVAVLDPADPLVGETAEVLDEAGHRDIVLVALDNLSPLTSCQARSAA